MKNIINENLKINIKKELWFFGNNEFEDNNKVKIRKPTFLHPLFLTTNISYADSYNDYGLQLVLLKSNFNSKILDFTNKSIVKKLNYPQIFIDTINKNHSDLNYIIYEIYKLIILYKKYKDITFSKFKNILSKNCEYLNINSEIILKQWIQAALFFVKKFIPNFKINQNSKISAFNGDNDEKFLRYFYLDFEKNGFDGFFKKEFNEQNLTLALFNIKNIDSLTNFPISKQNAEKLKKDQNIKTKKDLILFLKNLKN